METGQVRAEMNWNFCDLCEQETEEKLVCSLNSKRKNYGSGYKSFADNLQQFREIGELPIQASFSSLDEGNGTEETLKRHEAKWHKSCFNSAALLSCKGLTKDSRKTGNFMPYSFRIVCEQSSKDCLKTTTKAKLLSPSEAHFHFQPIINQLLNSWSPLLIFKNKSVRSKSKIKHIRYS